jgi:putative oxidoreductase
MDVVFLLGRLLFVPVFLFSALTVHFGKTGVEYARSQGAPSPDLMVPLSGVGLLLGGVMVALGLWADVGALFLVATLVPITWFMHPYWKISDPQQRPLQQAMFLKNLVLRQTD